MFCDERPASVGQGQQRTLTFCILLQLVDVLTSQFHAE